MDITCTDSVRVDIQGRRLILSLELPEKDRDDLVKRLKELDNAGPVRISLSLTTKECRP